MPSTRRRIGAVGLRVARELLGQALDEIPSVVDTREFIIARHANQLGFDLQAWDVARPDAPRTLFQYPNWTSWQPPMLVTLARLLDLDVLYLNEDVSDFVSDTPLPCDFNRRIRLGKQ